MSSVLSSGTDWLKMDKHRSRKFYGRPFGQLDKNDLRSSALSMVSIFFLDQTKSLLRMMGMKHVASILAA